MEALFTNKPAIPACRGLFYRYCETAYYQNGRFVRKQEVRPLKRISCSGCPNCGGILEETKCDVRHVEIDPKATHGDVLEARCVIDSTDWETGYVDDWHVVFSVVPPAPAA